MTNPLAAIRARRTVADLPWHVRTDTTDGPQIHDAYHEVARIEVPRAVWDCDDELDGCPDDRRESIRCAEFIAHAPADIDTLLKEVERLGAVVDEFQGALSMAGDAIEAFFEDDDSACSTLTRDMLATAQTRIHNLLSPPV